MRIGGATVGYARTPLRTFFRYLAFQIPGMLGVLLVLAVAGQIYEWSGEVLAGLFGAWVVKDLAMYPLVRGSYELRDAEPSRALIGRRARAEQALSPEGYVRMGSELWRARLVTGGAVAPGDEVQVVSVVAVTLVVEPAGAPDADPPAL